MCPFYSTLLRKSNKILDTGASLETLIYCSYWSGLQLLVWFAAIGLVYIYLPGLQLLAWFTVTGLVCSYWPGLQLLLWFAVLAWFAVIGLVYNYLSSMQVLAWFAESYNIENLPCIGCRFQQLGWQSLSHVHCTGYYPGFQGRRDLEPHHHQLLIQIPS